MNVNSYLINVSINQSIMINVTMYMRKLLYKTDENKPANTLHFVSLFSRLIQTLFLSGLQYLYTISTAELPQE